MALEQLPGRGSRGRDGRPDRRRRPRDATHRGRRPSYTHRVAPARHPRRPRPHRRGGHVHRSFRPPGAGAPARGRAHDPRRRHPRRRRRGDSRRPHDHRAPHARPQPGAPVVPRERHRLLHRRRPLPRHRRRHDARQLREPAPLDHGRAHEASARDTRPPRPHRSHHDRRGVGGERVRAALARRRPGRRRAVHGERPSRDARALRARLRRRPQGARAVGGRKPRRRPREPGREGRRLRDGERRPDDATPAAPASSRCSSSRFCPSPG